MTRGGRNILLLGAGSIAIAIITTGVSLFFYKTSGDIYLDRSRPGYLPDESENKTDKNDNNYKFSESGNITKEDLNEYLEKIKTEMDRLDKVANPFDESSLSDEALGISGQSSESSGSNSDGVDTNQDAQHIHD